MSGGDAVDRSGRGDLRGGAGPYAVRGDRSVADGPGRGDPGAEVRLRAGSPDVVETDVVVVGAGIGGLNAAWELTKRGHEVVVLEAAKQAGGPVRGGVFPSLPDVPLDLGAESFAVRDGAVEPLVDELGLTVEAPARLGAWGYAAGRAFPLPAAGVLGIPSRPWAADVRRAVGWSGVLRGSLDRVLPQQVANFDDLGVLVRCRMGARITDRLVAAVAAGVHSAPLDRLDVDAVAPGLRRAFAETGSLSAAVARLRSNAPAGAAVRGVDGGVHALVEAMTSRLDVRTSHRVTSISRGSRHVVEATSAPEGSSRWRVVAAGVEFWSTRLVVTSTDAAGLLPEGGDVPDVRGAASERGEVSASEDHRGAPLRAVPVPERGADIWLATLLLDAPELDAAPRGTGMLVAAEAAAVAAEAAAGGAGTGVRPAAGGAAGDRRRPSVRAKALTHSTAKWPWLTRRVREAAGPGMHIVRLSYGRIGTPTAEPSSAEALRDASALLGIDLTGRLRDFRTQHWDNALPPPTPAYRAQIRGFLTSAESLPGLALTGGWIAGTGLAAIINHSRKAATNLHQPLTP